MHGDHMSEWLQLRGVLVNPTGSCMVIVKLYCVLGVLVEYMRTRRAVKSEYDVNENVLTCQGRVSVEH